MSGFTSYASHVLEHFGIDLKGTGLADFAMDLIQIKYRAGYSVNACIRDLRFELHARLLAAEEQIKKAEHDLESQQ